MRENKSFKRLVIFAIAGIAALLVFSAMNVSAAPTAVIECDSTTDWTGYSATLHMDNSDYREWDGSIKVDGGSSGSMSVAAYNPSGTWDLSNDDYFVFWLKDSSSNTLTLAIEESDTDEVQYTFTSSNTWKTHIIDISGHKTTPDDPAGDGVFDWTDVNRFWIGTKSVDTTFWLDYITIGDANDFSKWNINKYENLVRNVDKNKFYYFTGSAQMTTGNDLWQAVKKASASDTIEAGPGTYTKSPVAQVNDLTIKALFPVNTNPSARWSIVKPSSAPGWPDVGAVNIRANGVSFDGFEVDALNCKIGVNAYGASNVVISNNSVHNADHTWDAIGIMAWDWTSASTVDNVIIENNEVYDTGRMGIFCMDYDTTNSEYDLTTAHVISGNTVYNTWTNPMGDAGGAIQINVGGSCEISDNEIYNTQNGNRGIYMFGSGSGNTIAGNDIHDNPIGMEFFIDGQGMSPIDWEGDTATSPDVTQNNIYDNTNYGAMSSAATGYTAMKLDAECNYWGDPSGPYHSSNPLAIGDTVSNKVDYNPWLTLSAPSTACNGGVCYNTVYVDDNYDSNTLGWNVDHFASIQDGIDRVCDCGTVEVAAGTYTEQVIIQNKNLKLKGHHHSDTIIKMPSSGIRDVYVAESSHHYKTAVRILGYDHYSSGNDTVWGPNTITVEMSGFSIDCDNYDPGTSHRFAAILMRNVNNDNCGKADIHHNKIYNLYAPVSPSAGAQTFGILGYGTMDVRIRGNRVKDFSRGGIGIYSGYADIKNNHVIGPHDGVTNLVHAPNGIQVGYGASGKIRKNTVSKCGWPGAAWAGTAIMVVDTSNVIVDDNYVHSNEIGIGIADFPQCVYGSTWAGVTSNVEVTNNHVEFCDWAIDISNDVDDVIVEGNTLNDIVYDGIGVYTYSAFDNTVSYNYDCTSSDPPTNIKVNYNSITSCGQNGLWVGANVTQTVNATYNWWGSVNGPTNATLNHFNVGAQGVNVTGNAQWIEWLLAPGTTTGFAPIYNIDTGKPFACIQEAIDHSLTNDGDIIECTDGTYTHGEPIQVTKGVTIQGGSKPIADGTGGQFTFEVKHDDVTIKNFKITNSNPSSSSYNAGIQVWAHNNILIRGCIIYDIAGPSSALDSGICFWGTDNSEAIWNHIRNIDDYGVRMGNGNDNLLVHKSTIKNCDDTGVYAQNFGYTNTEVHNCSIFGHTNYGMKNENTGYEFPACCNYWGAVNGPYHPTKNPAGSGDTVSDYVVFAAWLDAKHWDDPSCYAPVYNYDQDKWYIIIQDAVDEAMDGDTIGINGTFHENVVIDVNDLTIKPLDPMPTFASGWQGQFHKNPVVDGTGGRYAFWIEADGVTLIDLIIQNTMVTGGSNGGGICVDHHEDTTVENCYIGPISQTTNEDVGIWLWETEKADILNCNISAGDTDYGIVVEGSDDVEILESMFSNNDIGIYGYKDPSTDVEIHYCILDGNTNYGVKNDFTNVFDAECNYWGDASGPSGVGPGSGDAVSNNVDYDPWTGKLVVTATAPGSPTVWCIDPDVEFDGTVTPQCTYANPSYTVEWDFGDGGSSTIEDPTHTYQRGCYVAELTATVNVFGDTAIYSDTVDIWVKNSAPEIKNAYWDGPAWQQNLWNDRPILYLTTLVVPIEDCDGDLFDWSITSSPDIRSISMASDSDGEKYITFSGLQWSTTYTITVWVDDEYTTCPGKSDTGEDTRIFTFTTADCPDPAYVDDNYKYSTDGFGVDKFLTIQEGVDFVCTGGTIIVKDGLYEGADVHRTVIITGENLPIDTAVVETQLEINANDVEVYNLAFKADENGAVVVNSNGVIVKHNKFLKECIADAIGIVNNGGQVDARNNYWGAVDGPSVGTDPVTGHVADGLGIKIIGYVRFDPYAGINAKISKPTPGIAVETGEVVTFEGLDSTAYTLMGDPNVIDEYFWDFDDGTYSKDGLIGHSYDSVGNYKVSLRVRAGDTQLHNNFMYDWDYITVSVISPEAPLDSNADGGDFGGYETIVGEPIQLHGEATGGDGEYNYYWDFGDNTGTVEVKDPLHIYSKVGTYTATLTVTSNGESAVDTAEVLVKDISELVVQTPDVKVVTNVESMFTASIIGGEAPYSYEWDFGDGVKSEEFNPMHTYTTAGDYTVTLTVTDNIGEISSDTATITVEEGESNVEPVKITDLKGGFGLKAIIDTGNSNALCRIKVDGFVIFGGETEETFDANTIGTLKMPLTFALGKVDVTVTASSVQKDYTAFAIGPLFLKIAEA